ncbi:hypothetical protein [Streptomyces sp. NBC_01207]|uniref:hypothetical protein n=1 Tax=Streptomyces sp. NBC_01207 TaxID=2903772 RepID=UPI002E153D81|nr:hypothetical protein OG457_27455 [Streptomyces sp. NBC_01207]
MACACSKKKGVEVKATNGRTVYTSSAPTSAAAVAKRYPGSTVWQDGKQLDPDTLKPLDTPPPATPAPPTPTPPTAT